jgi:hypothetical protein
VINKYTLVFAAALSSPAAFAATIDISISNLTHAAYFTPLLVVGHNDSADVFELGTAASDALEAVAEGGDTSAFVTALTGAAAIENDPNGGPLAPGATTTITDMDTGEYDLLSIVAMVLPTNDGFVGLDSWAIPDTAGTYTIYLNAYDAGTEANNELIVSGSGAVDVLGIPADPGGNSGTGGTGVTTEETNATVHIHRGNIGDSSTTSGESDLVNTVHRWLNPVAKVVVTVK